MSKFPLHQRWVSLHKKDSPMHQAALSNNPDTINTLIAQGENVNIQNDNNSTPLHIAALVNTKEQE